MKITKITINISALFCMILSIQLARLGIISWWIVVLFAIYLSDFKIVFGGK